MPAKQPGQIDPATRSFQAVRIFVNRELDELTSGLEAVERLLRPGGILAVVSFHSLEDRIVKRFCRKMAGRPEHAHDSRTQDERVVRAEMISTRPVGPKDSEISTNPRSRSARMRALRKIS